MIDLSWDGNLAMEDSLCIGVSDVRVLHNTISEIEERSQATDAPASYQAFKGYKVRGTFMVRRSTDHVRRTVVNVAYSSLSQAESLGPIGAKLVSSGLSVRSQLNSRVVISLICFPAQLSLCTVCQVPMYCENKGFLRLRRSNGAIVRATRN